MYNLNINDRQISVLQASSHVFHFKLVFWSVARDKSRLIRHAYYSGMPCWSAMQRLKLGRLTPSRAGVPSGAARRYCAGHETGTPNSFATWSGQ